eukprot:gene11273-21442_t
MVQATLGLHGTSLRDSFGIRRLAERQARNCPKWLALEQTGLAGRAE